MKRAITAASLGLLLFTSTAAMAQRGTVDTIPVRDAETPDQLTGTAQFPYTFAAVRYVHNEYQVNNPNTTLEGDGFALDGSFLFLPSFFAVGSYSMVETDDIPGFGASLEISELTLGGGYRMDLTPNIDFNSTLRLVRQEAELSGFGESDDEIGYQLGAGVRAMLPFAIESRAEVTYLDIDEDGDLFLNLAGLYRFMPQLAAGAEIILNADVTSYALTGRWSF